MWMLASAGAAKIGRETTSGGAPLRLLPYAPNLSLVGFITKKVRPLPKFAANLSMMFTEHDFLDRFDAAAEAGFKSVEFLFPYDHRPAAIAERLRRNNLEQALFNLPPGKWDAGERGIAALPGRFDEFKSGLDRAIDYLSATGAKRVHMMSGNASRADVDAAVSYRRAICHAAPILAERGVDLLLEPINSRNMPTYFLNDFGYATDLIADLALPNLKLQFDVYHRQIMHGDVTMSFRTLQPIVAHVQIASVPSRNEPDGEELNYPYLFAEFDRLGYDGFVGCEYNPRAATREGLGWLRPYRRV
jgi:2-dehydrotetronate isomerase